jgi:hypothetical protein
VTDPSKAGRSPRWRDGITLLSVVGLFVTLFFNTLGVWEGAKDDKASRETQQIALLTTLNASATESESQIANSEVLDAECESEPELRQTQSEASISRGLHYYEYLSWLFNHDRLDIADARAFFAPRMVDGWNLAERFYDEANLSAEYPQLARFVEETRKEDRPVPRCGGQP